MSVGTGVFRFVQLFLKENISIVIALNLLLAIVAFGKDLLFAVYFGTTAYADVFSIAFFIPDTIGINLLGTALGVACVPLFSKMILVLDKKTYKRMVTNISIVVFSICFVISILIGAFGKLLLLWIGPGLEIKEVLIAYHLLLLLLPILLLYPILVIGFSILQSIRSFRIPAFAPVLFNIILVITLLYLLSLHVPILEGTYIFTFFSTFGISVTTLFVLGAAIKSYKKDFPLNSRSREYHENTIEINKMVHTFILYLLILLTIQAVLIVERNLASQLGTGLIAGLTYAYRIAQFPIWVFVAAINTVILPEISQLIANGAKKHLKNKLITSIRWTLGITLAMSLIFFVYKEPVVRILFLRGAFNETSLRITTEILAGYSLSIVGQGISAIILRYYLAIGKMAIPLAVFIFSAIVNIVLDFYLVHLMGPQGLGYAAALGWGVNALLLGAYFYNTFKKI